jgi:thioesterase III
MTEIKVRGYHSDFYGHVNNARYLEFLEEDRWNIIDASLDLGKMAVKGYNFLVVNININYRKAVPVGAVIVVSSGLEKINNRSCVLRQEIHFKDTQEIAVDALVTFVISDKRGKALKMEGELLEDIQKISYW